MNFPAGPSWRWTPAERATVDAYWSARRFEREHADELAAAFARSVVWSFEAMLAEPCDCDEPDFDLSEPRPGLTAHQRALLGALSGPRTTSELVGALGWRASVVGGVAASLHRRGLLVKVAGLWARL